ncbi:MAG: TatD family hydrolase [Chloroflexi bacterium]|nr:TatD family hydrolase [Chloroflexota bacterium]
MLVDTHAHLDSVEFKDDVEEVISRSLAAGVDTIITVGTDLESSRQAVLLAEQHHPVYAAVGIHPHEADQAKPDDLTELFHLSQHRKVVAIGEIGLDFYRNLSPAKVQEEVFAAQLELAKRAGKPIIIHDRQAHRETMAILSERAKGLHGVLHCFSGDLEMALQAVKMGFWISVAGPVTFQNAHRLQALVRQLPLEHVLIETDCPYLAPHPYRGQRNEPAYVRFIAARIAALKEIPLEQVSQVTTENARKLFALP